MNGTDLSIKRDEMETDDGPESEDAEAPRASMSNKVANDGDDDRMKEKIRQSLVRLARVLKRFAKKGEGADGDP